MTSAAFTKMASAAFPQRSDTMSLDVIRPKDIPLGKVKYYKDFDASLETKDIYKCKPYYSWEHYLNKPNYQVGVTESGYDGARTKTFYPPLNRPRDLSLTVEDIDYARPKNVSWQTNRCTDPICPIYDLPKSQVRPITPPRYNGRKANDVSDIHLTKPAKLIPDRNYIRDPNDSSDIEYSCPNYHRRVVRPYASLSCTSLDVKDINDVTPTNPRCTNPLDPTYKVSQTSTTSLHNTYTEEVRERCLQAPKFETVDIGPVPGSKPRKLQWDNGEPQFSLLREDIPGTAPQRWTGSVPYHVYDHPDKKAMISFHDPHDIPGAQAGSLRKGIETGRALNPLQPTYTFLDGKIVPTTTYRAQNALDAERGFPLRKCQSEVALSQPPVQKSVTPTMTPKPASLRSEPCREPMMTPKPASLRSEPCRGPMPLDSEHTQRTLSRTRSLASSSLTPHQKLDHFVGV